MIVTKSRRNGSIWDFIPVLFYLFLCLVRPYDWIGALQSVPIVTVTIGVGLIAMLAYGGFSLSTLGKTPHAWVFLGYFLWIVFASRTPVDTFLDIKSYFIILVMVVISLKSFVRLQVYIYFWTGLLVLLALLAVMSTIGMDLTGAQACTDLNKGRLCLNTWNLNNPNALAHTIGTAVSLLYFAMVWKRGLMSRIGGIVLICLIGYCVFLTQSKGGALVCFATFVGSQLFQRPKKVQIIILLLAATIGVAGVKAMPRMDQMSTSEAGIVGRLIAWDMARTKMRDDFYGQGWNKFLAHIYWEGRLQIRATHSSYVQIGASLGYVGLFLYGAILCSGLRTVFQARTSDEGEERMRRMIFAMLCSFAFSNWMIDRAYCTEFFLVMATAVSFHRLIQARHAPQPESSESPSEIKVGGEYRPLAFAGPVTAFGVIPSKGRIYKLGRVTINRPVQRLIELAAFAKGEDPLLKALPWNRLGFLDVAIAAVFFKIVLLVWDYTLRSY